MERLDKQTNRTVYNEERRDERRRFQTEPSKMHTVEVLVPWIVANVPAGSRLLDIGGGAGAYASEIVRAADLDVVGVDISEAMIEQRAEDPLLRENVVGDMEALPFTPDSFDAAMFVACLHHVPDPLPALREAWRVLRPGGLLLAVEPASFRARRAGTAPIPGHPHEFRMSRRRLGESIAGAGFEVEDSQGRQIAMRALRRLVRTPSLAMFHLGDALDRALRLVPGSQQLGEIAMIRARKPQ